MHRACAGTLLKSMIPSLPATARRLPRVLWSEAACASRYPPAFPMTVWPADRQSEDASKWIGVREHRAHQLRADLAAIVGAPGPASHKPAGAPATRPDVKRNGSEHIPE